MYVYCVHVFVQFKRSCFYIYCRGVTEGVTLLLLALQTGLLDMAALQRCFLLFIILFIVLTSTLQSMSEITEPVVLGLGASRNRYVIPFTPEQMTILMTGWKVWQSIYLVIHAKKMLCYWKCVCEICLFCWLSLFFNNCFCWNSYFCTDARLIQVWLNLPVYQLKKKKIK